MDVSVSAIEQNQSRLDIMAAAALCFEAKGFAATSIDDVARSLGATKGRIYHHFDSKLNLFIAVCRQAMATNFKILRPIYRSNHAPFQKLLMMSHAHVHQLIATKAFQRVSWEGVEMQLRGVVGGEKRAGLEPLLTARSNYSAMFRDVLLGARSDGAIQFDDLSVTTQLFFMSVNSPVFWYSSRPGESASDRDRLVNQIVQFALTGLSATQEEKK